jgi:hypothetical protein
MTDNENTSPIGKTAIPPMVPQINAATSVTARSKNAFIY